MDKEFNFILNIKKPVDPANTFQMFRGDNVVFNFTFKNGDDEDFDTSSAAKSRVFAKKVYADGVHKEDEPIFSGEFTNVSKATFASIYTAGAAGYYMMPIILLDADGNEITSQAVFFDLLDNGYNGTYSPTPDFKDELDEVSAEVDDVKNKTQNILNATEGQTTFIGSVSVGSVSAVNASFNNATVNGADVEDALSSKLTKENNLSDVANKATARTNLEVYSKSETDTKLGGKQDKVTIEYSNRLMGTSSQWKMTPFRSSRTNGTALELHNNQGADSKTYTKYSPTAVQVFTEVDSAAKEMVTINNNGVYIKARTTSSGNNLSASYLYYAAKQDDLNTGKYVSTMASGIALGDNTTSPEAKLQITQQPIGSLGMTRCVIVRNFDGAGCYATLSGEYGYCVTNIGFTVPLYYFKTDGEIYAKEIATESGFLVGKTYAGGHFQSDANPCVVLPDAQGGTFAIWKGTQAEYDALEKHYTGNLYFVEQTDHTVKIFAGTDSYGTPNG